MEINLKSVKELGLHEEIMQTTYPRKGEYFDLKYEPEAHEGAYFLSVSYECNHLNREDLRFSGTMIIYYNGGIKFEEYCKKEFGEDELIELCPTNLDDYFEIIKPFIVAERTDQSIDLKSIVEDGAWKKIAELCSGIDNFSLEESNRFFIKTSGKKNSDTVNVVIGVDGTVNLAYEYNGNYPKQNNSEVKKILDDYRLSNFDFVKFLERKGFTDFKKSNAGKKIHCEKRGELSKKTQYHWECVINTEQDDMYIENRIFDDLEYHEYKERIYMSSVAIPKSLTEANFLFKTLKES